jgi:DNA-binding transcriptional MerR regulator
MKLFLDYCTDQELSEMEQYIDVFDLFFWSMRDIEEIWPPLKPENLIHFMSYDPKDPLSMLIKKRHSTKKDFIRDLCSLDLSQTSQKRSERLQYHYTYNPNNFDKALRIVIELQQLGISFDDIDFYVNDITHFTNDNILQWIRETRSYTEQERKTFVENHPSYKVRKELEETVPSLKKEKEELEKIVYPSDEEREKLEKIVSSLKTNKDKLT